jgi:hypothetical protein
MTMCFQRDSRKDQIIVWAFLLGTAGLLGWAALRRFAEMRAGKKAASIGLPGMGNGRQERGAYASVGDGLR